jgi:hypothetical protein
MRCGAAALFVVYRGFPGAATGAGVTFIISLYVEGILAMGRLGGILRQIRIEVAAHPP